MVVSAGFRARFTELEGRAEQLSARGSHTRLGFVEHHLDDRLTHFFDWLADRGQCGMGQVRYADAVEPDDAEVVRYTVSGG